MRNRRLQGGARVTSGQRFRLLGKAARGRLHDKRTYRKDAKLAVGGIDA